MLTIVILPFHTLNDCLGAIVMQTIVPSFIAKAFDTDGYQVLMARLNGCF